MNNPKTIAYLRVSPKVADIDHRIEVMQAASQDALFVERGVRGNVPLEERPEFQKAYEHLQAGDTLLIWWMTDFGLGFKGAYEVIAKLLADNIHVKTYHQDLLFTPNDPQSDALLRLIKGYEEVETQQRLMAAELGRRKLRTNPEEWESKFQGRRANHEVHQKIAHLLATDKTLQAIADETGSSLSTVKRVKAKLQYRKQCQDQEGMRPRHGKGKHGHGHRTHGKQGQHRHGKPMTAQPNTQEKE